MLGHKTTDHPRQQNAQQQPGHHRAHHLAAVRLGGECGGGGHDVLRQCGRQAHRQAGHQQQRDRRCHAGQQQRHTQHRSLGQDDAAAVIPVPQRCQQQQAQRIPQLGEGGHQADGPVGRTDVRPQHPQHGLGVIKRRNSQPGTTGQQQGQPGRQAGGRDGMQACMRLTNT